MRVDSRKLKVQKGSGVFSLKSVAPLVMISLLLIFTAGCAKVVTPVFDPGKNLTIAVNFKDNIDTVANKYYIMFNNNTAPLPPFMPVQFVEPGDIPSQPEVDYYGVYYPTWKNYIVLDGNTFYLIKGPYTSEALPTKEVIATWNGSEPRKIMVTISLDKLAPTTDMLNFDIVTVDKTTKLVKDNLSSLNSTPSSYYIFTISDSTAAGSDEATPGIPGSLDILDWRMLIQ